MPDRTSDSRPGVGGDARWTSTDSASLTRRDRRVRSRGTAGLALGFAGDAQRGVRGGTARCGLPAAARRERRRLRDASAARSASRAPASRSPHKVTLFERVDEVDAVARRIGAINTIRVIDGRWMGGNTDVDGFLQPLVERVDAERPERPRFSGAAARRGRSRWRWRRAGAASASTRAIASTPNEVSVRHVGRGRAVPAGARQLGPAGQLHAGRDVSERRRNADRRRRPDGPLRLRPGLQPARARGCCARRRGPAARRSAASKCSSAQAQEQFEWWTGVRPPAGVMREAALKRLAEFMRDENHVV